MVSLFLTFLLPLVSSSPHGKKTPRPRAHGHEVSPDHAPPPIKPEPHALGFPSSPLAAATSFPSSVSPSSSRDRDQRAPPRASPLPAWTEATTVVSGMSIFFLDVDYIHSDFFPALGRLHYVAVAFVFLCVTDPKPRQSTRPRPRSMSGPRFQVTSI